LKSLAQRIMTLTAVTALGWALSSAQSLEKVPTLSFDDIRGRHVQLADYKGKVVLLNFWATWCAPCREEIPDLINLQRLHRGQGLQIIGITYPPENLIEVRRFARKLRMNYPVGMGTKETKTLFSSSETLPMTVVIDREGAVRDVIEGIMYPDEFEQKVNPLLSSQPAPKGKLQTATVVVGTAGYRPRSVKLRRGIPAELTFIRKVEKTCGTRIMIPDYGIDRPLPLNVPVTVALTPNKSGRFKFTCGMDMFRGSLVVR